MQRSNRLLATCLGALLLGPAVAEEVSPEAVPGYWERSRETAEALWDKSRSTVGDLWQQTRSLLDEEEGAEFARLWDGMLPRLDQALVLNEEQAQLPESAWFGRDRGDAQAEIDRILDQAVEILAVSPLQDYRGRIRALEAAIADDRQTIADLRARRVTAPQDSLWKETTKEIDAAIAERQARIARNQAALAQLRSEFAAELRQVGLDLDDQQLEFLLSTVMGDNLIELGIAFDNVKAITAELEQLVRNSGEDLESARRYYGMYLVLLQVLEHMHRQLLQAVQERFLPQIDAILTKTDELTADARRLLQESSANRAVLEANLEAQALTQRAAGAYRDYLLQQAEAVAASRARLERDIAAAWNTYETVKVSGELVGLIRSSQRMLDELLQRQVPVLRPFANLQMQREFAKLTERLRSGEAP